MLISHVNYNVSASFALSHTKLQNPWRWGVCLVRCHIPGTWCDVRPLTGAQEWSWMNGGTEHLHVWAEWVHEEKWGEWWAWRKHLLASGLKADTQQLGFSSFSYYVDLYSLNSTQQRYVAGLFSPFYRQEEIQRNEIPCWAAQCVEDLAFEITSMRPHGFFLFCLFCFVLLFSGTKD